MTKTIDQYQSGSADLTSGVCSRLYVDCDFAPKTHVTDKNPGPNSAAAHPWERNGLGVAPYRLVGSGRMTYQATPDAPVQPGTSCDYCGEGISNVFFIKAACGSHFKVGCNCVLKVSSKGDRVVKEVNAAVREAQKKARQARDSRKKDELGDLLEANRERFMKVRHPRPGKFSTIRPSSTTSSSCSRRAGRRGVRRSSRRSRPRSAS